MPSIYERQKSGWGGSFASDIAAMTLAGSGTPLGIVQNAQLQFAQQIARIYDVGNQGGGAAGGIVPVFYVGGRTQGQATIARVLGPQSGALCTFYQQMGNVCSPQDLQFSFAGGCNNVGGPKPTQQAAISSAVGPANYSAVMYVATACVMTNLGVSVASQDMIVNENISLMFANLECNSLA